MRPLAVTLAVVAALSGCGGSSSGEPRTLPAVSASSSASAATSPTPTGKDAPTPEGAAAFARFFYSEVQRAFATGDASTLVAISAPSCKSCRNLIDSVTAIRSGGGRVEGYRITVTTAIAPANMSDNARVDIVRNSTTSVEYDKSGKVVSREPGHTGIEEQVNLVRVGSTWRVTNIIRIRVRG